MVVIFAVIFIELGNAGAIQSKIKKMQESITGDTPYHQKKGKSSKHEEGSDSSSDVPHNNSSDSDSEKEEGSKKSEHKHRGKEAVKYTKLEKVKSDDAPSGCSD
uniref:Uncharacterized protein n=1 Tax=Globodera rostochiensis TaxID=31243 RepID=A0A914HMB8_GLORO